MVENDHGYGFPEKITFTNLQKSDIRRCQVLATCRNRSFKREVYNSFAYPFQCCASLEQIPLITPKSN